MLFASLAQVLPTDAFSAAALAQAVLVIAQALGDFGLSQAAVVALPALFGQRPEERGDHLRGATKAFLWASACGLGLALVAIAAVPAPARVPVLLIAPAAAVSVLVAGADGALRAQGNFREPVRLVIAVRLASFLAVPVAALTESAEWACAAQSVGTVLGGMPTFRVLARHWRMGRRARTRELLSAALPLGAAQLFVLAGGRLTTVIVSNVASLRAAAAFESSWRLFQLGQYVAGGLSTGAAPFIGFAVGARAPGETARLLMRLSALVTAAGTAFAVLLYATRRPVSDALFGSLGPPVASALVPFALLSPLAFLAFLAIVTLSATPGERIVVLVAHAVGATVGVALVVATGDSTRSAADACAIGLLVAYVPLCIRFGLLVARLRRDGSEMPNPGATTVEDGP